MLLPILEELYGPSLLPSEIGNGLGLLDYGELPLEADGDLRQGLSLEFIAQSIAELAERVGCEATESVWESNELIKEFNVKAFTVFAVTFLSVAGSASLLRHADVQLFLENGYCIARLTFNVDGQNSRVSAAIEGFTNYAERQKMRFDWRREGSRLTVTFSPVSKDWALLEVKSPIDDGDELIVMD